MDFSKNKYEDIRISVPWGHISGRWYGNRNRRPILALHGWMDNLGTWDLLIPHLPKHIGILAIDFPGHGQSSHYPQGMQYHVIEYVTVVMHIIKKYNWKKVSLMGHSMGCVVIYIYTALYPSTVDLIVNFDVVKQAFRKADSEIKRLQGSLIQRSNDITELENKSEPKSYEYKTLEYIIHKGSGYSVDVNNSKYLLCRSIEKCTQAYREFNVIKKLGIPLKLRDLFLEQITVCSLFGYEEFLNWRNVGLLMSWKTDNNGCGCLTEPESLTGSCDCNDHLINLALVYYINALLLL
ncbi:probable serine hydrolase [Teleopsis dalmanni]|uniref:probable serine hydrolase n=1 Tax=Teleopsis dalmanni TaxID=139649 RepID=UPI0018CCD61A|nr:probable serine hydrolase [Teleopsis dalmanni]